LSFRRSGKLFKEIQGWSKIRFERLRLFLLIYQPNKVRSRGKTIRMNKGWSKIRDFQVLLSIAFGIRTLVKRLYRSLRYFER